MVESDTTVLTDRQVEVIELREQGLTQQDVANELGTTDSNVSAIERAAEKNAEKARRTLELLQTIRAPAQFLVASGTEFDELVHQVYARGDDAGIKIGYCRPELYAHLYGHLEEVTHENRLSTEVRIGLTPEGEVKVFSE